MNTGALLFAFNNENTDYLELAAWSAKRIKKYLGIPVAVVTNEPTKADPIFDHIIYTDTGEANARMFEDYNSKTASWHNVRRTDAYELTPFDQTLVLDADYVVNSSMLAQYFNYSSDFMCYKDSFSMDQEADEFLTEYNSFGTHKFPMWWATVMLFKKSNTAAYIFDAMNMIRQNWNHYLELYKGTYGILIPSNELLNRLNFGWFIRMSPKQVLESNTIIGNYLLLSVGPEEKQGIIEPLKGDTKGWVGFWKIPSSAPYFGLKPNFLGNNINKVPYPGR